MVSIAEGDVLELPSKEEGKYNFMFVWPGLLLRGFLGNIRSSYFQLIAIPTTIVLTPLNVVLNIAYR